MRRRSRRASQPPAPRWCASTPRSPLESKKPLLPSLGNLLHLHEVVRSDEARAAFAAVVEAQPDNALVLSSAAGRGGCIRSSSM